MQIVWDEPKRLANVEKHGLDFTDLTVAFFLTAVILPAARGRSKAVNVWNGSIITAIFRPLGSEAVSVVSLRPAGRNERRSIL